MYFHFPLEYLDFILFFIFTLSSFWKRGRGAPLSHLESSASNLYIRHWRNRSGSGLWKRSHTHTDFSSSALNKSPQNPGGKAVWFKWSLWWIYKIKLHFIIEVCPFTIQHFWIISTKVLPFMKTSTRRKFHLNQTSKFSGLLRLLNPRDWRLSKPKCSITLRKEKDP